MSLWAVPDEQTAELMINFYQRYLTTDDNKAEALRWAMLEMKKQYPEEPGYWAAFTLVGSAD